MPEARSVGGKAMFHRNEKFWTMALAIVLLFSPTSGFLLGARAGTPAGVMSAIGNGSLQGLLHKVDTFPNCRTIYWCGVRRDGRPYCGPVLRCRTCKFVRKCRRATGCAWEEKCRWGPYVPPTPQ